MSIHSLYETHFDAVYKFFYFKSFDQLTSEDLTSQTFLIMLEKMHSEETQIKDQKKFLYGIMRNVWLRHLQEKYRRAEEFIESINDFEQYVYDELAKESSTSDEARVQRYIEKLPDSQRHVLEMRLLRHLTLSEICEELHRDMNYVKTTQRRGIQTIKRMLHLEQDAEGGQL